MKKCNCQKSRECPLDGNCVVESVIYQAEILQEGEIEGNGHTYVGLAGGLFKFRMANHAQSCKNINNRKQSKLSEYIWDLKSKGIENFILKWSVLAHESGFNRKSRRCQLCIREKVEILCNIKNKANKAINKREEIFRRCLHRRKHFLGDILENYNYEYLNQNNHQVLPLNIDHQENNSNTLVGVMYKNLTDTVISQKDSRAIYSNTHQYDSTTGSIENREFERNNDQNEALVFGSTRSGKIWRMDNVDQT